MDILGSFFRPIKGKYYVVRKVKQNGLSIDESQRIKNNQFEKRLGCIRSAHNEKKDNEIRTDRMEDYLEVIYEPIQQKGYATTADIPNISMSVLQV